jgi:ubiquinone biosynthesis protein COQ9
MDLEEMRDRILLATLPHIAFEGWGERALQAGAADAGVALAEAKLAFPGGALEMIEHWGRYADHRLLDALADMDVDAMRVRAHIAAAVRCRIEVNIPYREAVRRTIAYLALPANASVAARSTYETVNAIWYACGDTATDFSFYTKRATLACVYAATVLYWLDDASDDFADSWGFLDRRIDDVMQITRLRSRLSKTIASFKPPLPAWRRAKARI